MASSHPNKLLLWGMEWFGRRKTQVQVSLITGLEELIQGGCPAFPEVNWTKKRAEAGPYHRKTPFSFLESMVGPTVTDVLAAGLYYSSDKSQNLSLGFSRERLECTHLLQRHCPGKHEGC